MSAPEEVASPVLARWNEADAEQAAAEILACCGSRAWAAGIAGRRPLMDEDALLSASMEVWESLTPLDWEEAFRSHPRLGERKPQGSANERSLAWSRAEQSVAMSAEEGAKRAVAEGNAQYEERFGRIFILCARGRSAAEVLAELQRRMGNAPDAELIAAAGEQQKITELRLRQWLENV